MFFVAPSWNNVLSDQTCTNNVWVVHMSNYKIYLFLGVVIIVNILLLVVVSNSFGNDNYATFSENFGVKIDLPSEMKIANLDSISFAPKNATFPEYSPKITQWYVKQLKKQFRYEILRNSEGYFYNNGTSFIVSPLKDSNAIIIDTDISPYSNNHSSVEIFGLPSPLNVSFRCSLRSSPPNHDMLIVFTTSNELNMTVMSLKYLTIAAANIADILIVDDHSIDGTVPYLRKRGFHVISKSYPSGLTDSWNIGYHFARKLGYNFIVIANNDILVPSGALDIMRYQLFRHTVVVPSTTKQGSGHNPAQSLMSIFNLSSTFSDYIDNPRNVENIQDMLSKYFGEILARGTRKIRLFRREVMFPRPAIFSQWNNVVKFNGFLFGLNLTSAPTMAYQDPDYLFDPLMKMVGQEDSLSKILLLNFKVPMISTYSFVYHFKSVTVARAKMGTSKYSLINGVDSRENLSFYHPEVAATSEQSSTNSKINDVIRSNINQGSLYIPKIYSFPEDADSERVTIGIAISNPILNPSAGDLFTAMELSNSLEKISNVDVVYLFKGISWYDIGVLSKLDVVISLLDDFDLRKMYRASKDTWLTLKPNLVTVAWIRNWFHRWSVRPFFGNFDVILTSSRSSFQFYSSINNPSHYGCHTDCFSSCPAAILSASHGKNPSIFCHEVNKWYPSITVANSHSIVDIHLFPIATNVLKFHPGPPSSKYAAHYVFTGSYHNVFRKIMSFDPSDILHRYRGIIIGSNWNTANVSDAFRSLVIGNVPYSEMPEIYRSVKIVIDDANHVTEPWGSVNSRVFDALVSGALVISNGKLGSWEMFGGLLPVFENGIDLKEKIVHYLENEAERIDLVHKLSEIVRNHHTYDLRVIQLGDILMNHGVVLKKLRSRHITIDDSQGQSPFSIDSMLAKHGKETSKKSAICIGIRTMPSHSGWIRNLVENLVLQHYSLRSNEPASPDVQVFMMDTENRSPVYREYLLNVSRWINDGMDLFSSEVHAHVLWDEMEPIRESRNRFYGYDITDLLVSSLTRNPSCEWIMLTNGDNNYNKAWLSSIFPYLNSNNNIVAWDFITHHSRSNSSQQLIRVDLKRGYIDLGSMIVRSQLYLTSKLRFLDRSFLTPQIFARDFFSIQSLTTDIKNDSIVLLHQCLLFHQ